MYEKYISNTIIIIPTYKATSKIEVVLERLSTLGFRNILVVNDCCPENCTSDVSKHYNVISTPVNRGVGGAFMYGVENCLKYFDVNSESMIFKIDADNQHDPSDIFNFFDFLSINDADFLKGNRYLLNRLPVNQSFIRKIGNVGLSFLNKFSTGYWHVSDPVNGLFMIKYSLISSFISDNLVESRYLFESSLLYACSRYNATVYDVPNRVIYDGEVSSLNIKSELFNFGSYYFKNICKRLSFEYFYPNFNINSINLLLCLLLPYTLFYAMYLYAKSHFSNIQTETGTLILLLMLFLIGILSFFNFINYDYSKSNNRILCYKFLRL